MKRYLSKVKQCIKGFTMAKFHQIPREENLETDSLAKVESVDELVDNQIKVQYIPSIDIPEVHQIDREANQTTPTLSYLKDGLLLEDREDARKLKVRAVKFVLMDKILYKKGFSQPYLRWLTLVRSKHVMRDIHEGICGNHLRARSLVHTRVRAGYYWPSMQANAQVYVKACDKCQCFSRMPR